MEDEEEDEEEAEENGKEDFERMGICAENVCFKFEILIIHDI